MNKIRHWFPWRRSTPRPGDQVNAMLLNEFLKEHRTVRQLKATVAQQQNQIEALTAGLQKVSAQLEVSKTAPQTVLNNR
jgi:cell division FtsZ-interacting protein ZapD